MPERDPGPSVKDDEDRTKEELEERGRGLRGPHQGGANKGELIDALWNH